MKKFIIEALRTIMLICCIPILWVMEFSSWLQEKLWSK